VAFPRRLLNDFEDIVLDLNPHWLYFAEPGLALIAALVVTILLEARFDPPDLVTLFFVALILVLAIWFATRYVKWTTTNFVVTTDRLIFRSGIFAKHGIEIPLERVNNVIFHQSLLERIVGAGDLMIESGSEHGQQHFTDIKHPDLVQNEIHAQMEANENRKYDRLRGPGTANLPPPPPPAPAHDDVATQLERLAELRAKGILSQAEFDAKKAELLKRL
jgi:membrane protein YdbS with pleckstrin-like domain